jgi:hypothetical protein
MLTYQTSFPGGDTQVVGNFEYRIPIAPHVSASIFGDIGATGALRHNQLQLNSTDLTTLQQTFAGSNTTINSQLPYQPGTNFKLRTSAGVEIVVQLPIVQAPFRIFWAYNFNRMSQIITAPTTQFPGNPNNMNPLNPPCDSTKGINTNCFDMNWFKYENGLPADVWDQIVNGTPSQQGILQLYRNPQRTNFFDPVRTLRFTVSRTF